MSRRNAPDSIHNLIRDLRELAEDRYTPRETTTLLTEAADALEADYPMPKKRAKPLTQEGGAG